MKKGQPDAKELLPLQGTGYGWTYCGQSYLAFARD